MRSFASYLLAILVGIGAIALWFAGLALTVLGMTSALSGGPRGWWIPLGLFLFVFSFLPTYSIFRRLSGPA